MWRSEALFCLSNVVEPMFLCLFYANACQLVILVLLILVFATWKLIVSSLGGSDADIISGREEEIKKKLDDDHVNETSFATDFEPRRSRSN